MRHLGELTITSKFEEIEKVTDFIANCADRLGLKRRQVLDTQICVDEACSNVIAYAYPNGAGQVLISCDHADGGFVVTVRDEGLPFDPLEIPEPDLASDLDRRPLGGLGIHLIKTLMDEVSYERDGSTNVLVMVKKVTS